MSTKKDRQTAELVEGALRRSPYLQQILSAKGVARAIIHAMQVKTVPAKKVVIREGAPGDEMFVCASGRLQVLKGDEPVKDIAPGEVFGELSLIYNTPRKGSVVARTECTLWVLDEAAYTAIIEKYFKFKDEDFLALFRSVSVLEDLSDECLLGIRGVVRAECYPPNTTIIREGEDGNEFFMITGGTVTVHVLGSDGQQKKVAKLGKGNFFGEKALLKNEKTMATVTADPPGVECMILDREDFLKLFANKKDVRSTVEERTAVTKHVAASNAEHHLIELDDLEVRGILGNGSSGEVQLVQSKDDPSLVFALKKIKKYYIAECGLTEYVMSEKDILLSCASPFIIRLYKTFKDSKYVYFLTEACLGGDVRYLMENRRYLDERMANFIAACAVEALAYLHDRGIIYRDLKTENLVFDTKGYVKLVDFGYSKRIDSGRTRTNLGTAAYMAPEVTAGDGYDRSADYWSLGVLVYELLTGSLPFGDDASDGARLADVKNIKNASFPSHVSKGAKSIIKKLCNQNPDDRLGYRQGVDEIRNHAWFSEIPWQSLRDQTFRAPYVPKIQGATDCSNFRHCPRDKEIPADVFADWDREF